MVTPAASGFGISVASGRRAGRRCRLRLGRRFRSPREDELRVHSRDLDPGQLHVLGRHRVHVERRGLGRAEQAVVEVAAGRPPGPALVPEERAGRHGLARLDDDLAEVRVDAPIPVAVVDDHDDRQRDPELLGLEPGVVLGQVADPAHLVVVVPARGQDDTVVGGHDLVAAEGRKVDAVVELLAVDDPAAPRCRAERERQPGVRERPPVAGEAVESRAAVRLSESGIRVCLRWIG